MKTQKSVLVSLLENMLQSFAFGGGTGRTLVKNLDKSPFIQELGALYLRLLEDRASALLLNQEETAALHRILEDLLGSFTLNHGATGKALVASVKKYAAKEKDSPVSEIEMALYLRLDAAMKRETKLAA
jgi:hypothetical protein